MNFDYEEMKAALEKINDRLGVLDQKIEVIAKYELKDTMINTISIPILTERNRDEFPGPVLKY